MDVFLRNVASGSLERISLSSGGKQARGASYGASLSADARFIAFSSGAPDLIPGDRNRTADVFVRDRVRRTTERVSLSSEGREADGPSGAAAMSADGRYVAFISDATNLVQGDTNTCEDYTIDRWDAPGTCPDVFVRDRKIGRTVRVTLESSGAERDAPTSRVSMSADGRFVAFQWGRPPGQLLGYDVYLRDMQTGNVERISEPPRDPQPTDPLEEILTGESPSEPDGHSYSPTISADGSRVAFLSTARNLVSPPAQQWDNIYLYDRRADSMTLVSVSSEGIEGNGQDLWWPPAVSRDGARVAWTTASSNLSSSDGASDYDVFVRDIVSMTTVLISSSADGRNVIGIEPAISANGNSVAFTSRGVRLARGEPITCPDHDCVYLRRIADGRTLLISKPHR